MNDLHPRDREVCLFLALMPESFRLLAPQDYYDAITAVKYDARMKRLIRQIQFMLASVPPNAVNQLDAKV